MRTARAVLTLVALSLLLSPAVFHAAQTPAAEPSLTKEQMQRFLTTAKVVSSKQTSKGITSPWRLKLTDGTLTHEAAFQSVDEHKMRMDFGDGTTELNFVDSYEYDLAAY